jgi:hypothetical protein
MTMDMDQTHMWNPGTGTDMDQTHMWNPGTDMDQAHT